MGLAAPQPSFTAADYLAWEAEQPERHDFLDGEVFAMGATEDLHVTVGGNLYIALRQHLSGGPYRTLPPFPGECPSNSAAMLLHCQPAPRPD